MSEHDWAIERFEGSRKPFARLLAVAVTAAILTTIACTIPAFVAKQRNEEAAKRVAEDAARRNEESAKKAAEDAAIARERAAAETAAANTAAEAARTSAEAARKSAEAARKSAEDAAIINKEAAYPFNVPQNRDEGAPSFFLIEPPLVEFSTWVGFNDTLEGRADSQGNPITVYCRSSYDLPAKRTSEGLYEERPSWYSFPHAPRLKKCSRSAAELVGK